MNKEGQPAGAEAGGVRQRSMWCPLHLLVVGLPVLTPKVPANSRVTCPREGTAVFLLLNSPVQ